MQGVFIQLRKIGLTTLFILFVAGASAQVNPHAIGVRGLWGGYGWGGELSYQHGMGDQNRLELDLGWRGRGFEKKYNSTHLVIHGIYHWVRNISDGFNWYVGLGGAVGLWNDYDGEYDDGITLGLGGQAGLEYDFKQPHNIPILISIDVRPMLRLFGGSPGLGYGGAFSLRYVF